MLSPKTKAWLVKFSSVEAALEEREIYHAESGMDRELDFEADRDIVYSELCSLIEP